MITVRRRSRITIAAVAAALFLCVAPSAEAAGKRLVGVNGVPAPNAVGMARLAAGGTDTIRISVGWRQIEPLPGFRDWVHLDSVVAGATGAGMEVLPVLTHSPKWVSGNNPAAPPIYSGTARAAWSAFITDLVARYGTNGTFWAAHPELPRRPFRYYQVWNEVNLRAFWGGRPNPRGYAELVGLTSRALSADPDAKLLLAGLIPYRTASAGSVDGTTYLKRLLKFRALRRHVDAVAVHPYGRVPRVVIKGIERIREVLSPTRTKKPGKRIRRPRWVRKLPIFVTEFGWATGGELWNISPVRADPGEQARWVKRSYKLMRKNAKRLRLRRALYFNVQDFDAEGTDYWSARMGLFDLAGNPKPAWFAYVRRAGGTP